jgi:hypothetical protein
MVFPKLSGRAKVFGQVQKNWISLWDAALARIYLPKKARGGLFNVRPIRMAVAHSLNLIDPKREGA